MKNMFRQKYLQGAVLRVGPRLLPLWWAPLPRSTFTQGLRSPSGDHDLACDHVENGGGGHFKMVAIFKWNQSQTKTQTSTSSKFYAFWPCVWYIVDGRPCNTLMLQSFPHGTWVTLFGTKNQLHGIGKIYLYLHYSNNISCPSPLPARAHLVGSWFSMLYWETKARSAH